MSKNRKDQPTHEGTSEYQILRSLLKNYVPPHYLDKMKPDFSLYPTVDTPPIMVKKIMKVSKDFGGPILCFRSNASLPLYLIPSAPKPSSIKAKTCKRKGFCEGAIPEINSSKILGNIIINEKNTKEIQPYNPQELERRPNSDLITTPLVQLDYSLKQIVEGLDKHHYEMISTEAELKVGLIKVKEIIDIEIHKGVIYSINLMDKFQPPLMEVKYADWRIAAEPPLPQQPIWWPFTSDEWRKMIEYRYPAFYQGKGMDQPMPLRVYGREILKEGKKHILPITGDQDSLWITIPAYLQKELKAPDLFFEPINTLDTLGPEKMFDALINMSEYFKNINRDDLVLSIADVPDRVLSGMGTLSPYEAYITICINKLIAYETHHIQDLIQHGCDNRNPGKPSTLNNKVNHISCNFQIQTKNAEELIKLASSNYYNETLVDLHPKWGDIALPLAQSQEKIRERLGSRPLPEEIVKKFHLTIKPKPPSTARK